MLNSKKIFIFIFKNLIISLIFIFISIFSIYYINRKIETITDTIILNRKLKNELKNKNKIISMIDKNIKKIGKNKNRINNSFPPSNNISEFINKLDELTITDEIIQKYYFDTPLKSDISSSLNLSTISYSNTITSNLDNFIIYLKSFEKIPYFTKIESINISSQDKLGWKGKSNIKIKAVLITKSTK